MLCAYAGSKLVGAAKIARGARLRPLWSVLLDADRAGLGGVDAERETRTRLATFSEADPTIASPTVPTPGG